MRIAIFDFDGTLFKSPERPSWWPLQGFWGRLETLSPPFVPENPGSDWWASSVVSEAKQAISDAKTISVLLTGRPGKLGPRIKDILHSNGLRFDEYFFAGAGAGGTLGSKLGIIEKLVDRTEDLKLVEMWDDRPEHVGPFEDHLKKLGVEFEVHTVPRVTHDFEVGPEGFQAEKVAARFIK
jgi:hypothetical protein